MQGIKTFIPTKRKVDYIQSLLRVGFDTIDFGSFVSPKAIPQMQDTAEVLAQLDLSQTTSKLLAIIAHTQGAQSAKKKQKGTRALLCTEVQLCFLGNLICDLLCSKYGRCI